MATSGRPTASPGTESPWPRSTKRFRPGREVRENVSSHRTLRMLSSAAVSRTLRLVGIRWFPEADCCIVSVFSVVEVTTYIQKHHLQIPRSANVPPRTGPTPMLTPKTPTNSPKYKDRRDNGTIWTTIANAPCIKPAAPQPAAARPRMNARDDGAVAQDMEPATTQSVHIITVWRHVLPSNIAMEMRYMSFVSMTLYSFPQVGCRAVNVRR